MEKLLARQAVVSDLIEQHDAWELDTKLERAMGCVTLSGRRYTY